MFGRQMPDAYPPPRHQRPPSHPSFHHSIIPSIPSFEKETRYRRADERTDGWTNGQILL